MAELVTEDAIPAAELARAGALIVGAGCAVSGLAVFRPYDGLGQPRPIVLGHGVAIGDFTVVHGGTELGDAVRVESHVVVGQPDQRACRLPDLPATRTVIGTGAVLRAGAVLYAGVEVGTGAVVGHHALLRPGVRVGPNALVGPGTVMSRDVPR